MDRQALVNSRLMGALEDPYFDAAHDDPQDALGAVLSDIPPSGTVSSTASSPVASSTTLRAGDEVVAASSSEAQTQSPEQTNADSDVSESRIGKARFRDKTTPLPKIGRHSVSREDYPQVLNQGVIQPSAEAPGSTSQDSAAGLKETASLNPLPPIAR